MGRRSGKRFSTAAFVSGLPPAELSLHLEPACACAHWVLGEPNAGPMEGHIEQPDATRCDERLDGNTEVPRAPMPGGNP